MDTFPSSRTRSTYNLPRGSSSLSAHKASASALVPPKHTSRALLEPSPTSSTKKRKKKEDILITAERDTDDAVAGSKRSTKKAKLGFRDSSDVGPTIVTKLKPEKKKKTKGDKDLIREVARTKGKSGEKEVAKDKKEKKGHAAEPVVSEGEEGQHSEQNLSSSDSEEDDGGYVPPAHESLAGAVAPKSNPSSKKSKNYVPPDETRDQRDSRTIFVGNVPSQVMTTKVSQCHIYLLVVLLN